MKQKNVQKDNVNGTGNLVVEKIVESKKGGIFVLAMVLLFWCALLFALPALPWRRKRPVRCQFQFQ